MLLGIIARPNRRDKFEVNSESVALLTALVACSDEVRSRCHVKHTLPNPVEISDTLHLTHPHVSGQQDDLVLDTNFPLLQIPLARRQKSFDILDQSAIAYARQHKAQQHQVSLWVVWFPPRF